MATISWPRFMPMCSAIPSRSARANNLGMGKRYRSSRRTEVEEGGAAGSGGLRGARLRVTLLGPSSLRATDIRIPPQKKLEMLGLESCSANPPKLQQILALRTRPADRQRPRPGHTAHAISTAWLVFAA